MAMVQKEVSSSGTMQLPKYQIVMALGEGGMGQVHLAMSRGPRGFVKLVVLKTLKAELRGSESTYRMFLEEARISARLAHPNLVQTYEVIELDDIPSMVLEYIEGQSLASILEQSGQTLTRDLYLSVLVRVLAGLHAAHELRDFDGTPLHLVHRDMSPHNVMLQYDGQVKVLDFGIAKTERSRVATETGVLKGKIRYMAPEQLAGDDIDKRVDIFAVGIMLWEALANTRLWGNLADGDIMRGLLNDSVPRLPIDAGIPKELEAICYRAIAVNPSNRYASAGEFQRDLEAFLQRQGSLRSSEELGRYLCEHFETQRRHAQQRIQEHIQALQESIRPSRPDGTEEITTVPGRTGMDRVGSKATPISSGRPLFRDRVAFALAGLVILVGGGSVVFYVMSRPTLRSASSGAGSAPRENVPPICATNAKSCNGNCVSLDRPELGCGSPSCQLCGIANATPRCNQHNECDIAVCYQAFDNCDGDVKNGCEANVRIDPDNCGGCGRRCPELPHAERGCGDVCTIWRCKPGHRDCNGVVTDGCEIDTATDPHNCGHCGIVCPANTKCRAGECQK